MTKERLEELIKQRGTICCRINNNGVFAEYDLSVYECAIATADDGELFVCINNTDSHSCHYLRDIFETKEQIFWYNKIHAERTERFEPPMWEDIKDKYSFMFVDYNNRIIHFSVFKKYKSVNHIVVYSNFNDKDIYYDMSTKENYEKACEIVRDLFRGTK